MASQEVAKSKAKRKELPPEVLTSAAALRMKMMGMGFELKAGSPEAVVLKTATTALKRLNEDPVAGYADILVARQQVSVALTDVAKALGVAASTEFSALHERQTRLNDIAYQLTNFDSTAGRHFDLDLVSAEYENRRAAADAAAAEAVAAATPPNTAAPVAADTTPAPAGVKPAK